MIALPCSVWKYCVRAVKLPIDDGAVAHADRQLEDADVAAADRRAMVA